MPKAPSQERITEIRTMYENRQRSRAGKETLWRMIGELLAGFSPIVMEPKNRSIVAPVPERPMMAHAAMVQSIGRPETPTPSQWKRMSQDEQSAHFHAVQQWEASLTPEQRTAIAAAEGETQAEWEARNAAWKSQFDPERPYVRPGA